MEKRGYGHCGRCGAWVVLGTEVLCAGCKAKNPIHTPLRAPVTLSTGRVVIHRHMDNGAQFAFIANAEPSEMTASEWDEYCAIIAGTNAGVN